MVRRGTYKQVFLIVVLIEYKAIKYGTLEALFLVLTIHLPTRVVLLRLEEGDFLFNFDHVDQPLSALTDQHKVVVRKGDILDHGAMVLKRGQQLIVKCVKDMDQLVLIGHKILALIRVSVDGLVTKHQLFEKDQRLVKNSVHFQIDIEGNGQEQPCRVHGNAFRLLLELHGEHPLDFVLVTPELDGPVLGTSDEERLDLRLSNMKDFLFVEARREERLDRLLVGIKLESVEQRVKKRWFLLFVVM